jgi:hypothetical protein
MPLLSIRQNGLSEIWGIHWKASYLPMSTKP